eukprot:2506727-Prorocentrum_lima.AAC.1
MTSSLVGSEMCIRDSACALPTLGPCRMEKVLHILRLRNSHGSFIKLGPVSYTHLTLPTICSV